MAFKMNAYGDGTMDTTLGLIMRLNRLWDNCDTRALAGDFTGWNFTLDCIYRNLLYRDPLEEIRDDEGNIIDVKLSQDDQKLWLALNAKVIATKNHLKLVRSQGEYHTAMNKYYQALGQKDVGLRKFMFKLKLYLKETNKNPAKAMWGG